MRPAVLLSIFTLAAGTALALPLEDPNPRSFAVRSNGLHSGAADDLASRALRALTWPLSSNRTKASDNVCKKTWQSRQTTGEECLHVKGAGWEFNGQCLLRKDMEKYKTEKGVCHFTWFRTAEINRQKKLDAGEYAGGRGATKSGA